jgi:hypothetical protein
MRVMKQIVAVMGLAMLGGAGCASDGAEQEIGPENREKDGVLEPGEDGVIRFASLDATTAARMDRKHKSKQGPSEGADVCYSIGGDQRIKRLNMTTQAVTTVFDQPLSGPGGTMSSGMGHFGGALVACSGIPGGQGILIFDLDGQAVKSVDLPCQAVSGDGERLWVLESLHNGPWTRILEFTSFADLVADQPSRELPGHSGFSLGTSVERNQLLTSWHSSNEVWRVDLETGAKTVAPLDGFDGWIFGVHETAEHRYVIGSWSEDQRGVHVFDPETGENQGRKFTGLQLNGLTCDVR